MTGPLFRQLFGHRVNQVLSSVTPRAELAHALRLLITTVGLVQLSSVLHVARTLLPGALVAVVDRTVYGHAQLLAVHAAEVTARAVAMVVRAADLELTRENLLQQAVALGPCREDPREVLTGHLQALEAYEADAREICAGLALLTARLGLHGLFTRIPTDSPGPSQVAADIPRTPTTRPAPPPDGTEVDDAT